jgi:2-hydroxy-6-oxonona-2,4-dienedioate hydrolase
MSIPLRLLAAAAAAALGGAMLGTYRGEIAEIRRRVKAGGRMAQTKAGPIEYAVEGSGPPALVIHGAGGGYDQGLLLGRNFSHCQIIAPSRFGYLGTPTPQDVSAAAQADAHAALLDSLGIEKAIVSGTSAGAPSAVEMALRHADRVRALILIVPRGYWSEQPEESRPPDEQVMRLVMSGADLSWWLAMRLVRSKVVQFLGVPPEVEARASSAERERVNEIMKSIQPLSMRIEGIRNEAAVTLGPLPLERITTPTLVISARDDLYNTLPAAQHLAEHILDAKLVVLDSGGHLLVGHMQYLEQAMGACAISALLRGKTEDAPIVGLLEKISELSPDKIVVITRTLGQMSHFNEIVREQISQMSVAERYEPSPRASTPSATIPSAWSTSWRTAGSTSSSAPRMSG